MKELPTQVCLAPIGLLGLDAKAKIVRGRQQHSWHHFNTVVGRSALRNEMIQRLRHMTLEERIPSKRKF